MIKKQSGQTLLEVLIGLAAAVIVIGAISVTTFSALNNAQFGKNQNAATAYAQEGIEIARNMRDRNYGVFKALDGSYCLGQTCTQIDTSGNGNRNIPSSYCGVSPCQQNIGIFIRQITVTNSVATECGLDSNSKPFTKVTANVSWYDNKCGTNPYCHNVTISSCFSDYTVKPTL